MKLNSEKIFIELLNRIDVLPAGAAWDGASAKLQKRTAAVCGLVYLRCVVASLAVQWYGKKLSFI
jgi:hypothetical protein